MAEHETKPKEQFEMERAAEEIERKIVRFRNIDEESFTHSFRGISQTIAAGASLVLRLPEADHLATHLARKILSRRKKASMGTGDPRGVQLWTEAEVNELKSQILSEMETQPSEAGLSAQERHDRDVAELNKKKPEPKNKGEKPVTKKEVIKELESRGATVDEKKSLEELLQQLMDLEAGGQ